MNPALSSQVWSGNLYLPKRYPLKVLPAEREAFEMAYEDLPDNKKSPHQVGLYYKVRSGDTLSRIASRYGSSVSAIQRANRLRSAHQIRIGQRLLIPPRKGGSAWTPPPTAVAQSPSSSSSSNSGAAFDGTHVVRRGETLARIAGRYGTSVSDLMRVNGLRNAHKIHVGQRLKVPTEVAQGGSRMHRVQPGETLTSIAKNYGTSVRALQRANKIRGHLIKPSQLLVIP